MKTLFTLFVLFFSSSMFAESIEDRLNKIEKRLDNIEKFLELPTEDILTDFNRLELLFSYLEKHEPGYDRDCTKKVYMNSSEDEKNSIYTFFWVLFIAVEKQTLSDSDIEKLWNQYGLSWSDAMKINEKFHECF